MNHPHDDDAKTETERSGPKILIAGAGGAGCCVASKISESERWNGKTVAIDTDGQELVSKSADKKILLDRTLIDDLEAENSPGKKSNEIRRKTNGLISGTDVLILTSGLGGNTGSKISPAVAHLGKKAGALVISIVTLPFERGGNKRKEIAEEGQRRLSKEADMVVLLSAGDVMERSSDLPIEEALDVMDEELASLVLTLVSLVEDFYQFDPGFESVNSIFGEMGLTRAGRAECDIETKGTEIAEKIIESPLLRTNLPHTGGALLQITSGSKITPEKVEKIVERISEEIGGNGQVIWETRIDKSLGDVLRAFLLAPDTRFGMMDLDIEVL
ncbi:hypothetical protein AKJ38_03655 [candidate division MSBL1 archaeon SCGC-AAA259I14]|uniref:Tubulin/FtsZ GTPase domain-containing protein n=1 Tax=candidate division MSBL1 archaeon SCGC-AAA259I14 TaxID=1698268 RepID=A0A133UPY0_9EURY|nr:hypothetical protein AKJ38_03655 [candidate division MSBL1 archaeon SCGC-AAA259I14]